MNTRAALTAVVIVAAFAVGWIARHMTYERYRIVYGEPHPILKIDTRTGATWRYYVNTDPKTQLSVDGFIRLKDR